MEGSQTLDTLTNGNYSSAARDNTVDEVKGLSESLSAVDG